MNDMFKLSKKIYYHDTDSGGVVYYGDYLNFFEEARTEFCLARGIDIIAYEKDEYLFPVVHVEVDYKKPARYGDLVDIYVRVVKVGRCKADLSYDIIRDKDKLVEARITWACLGKNMRPRSFPDEMRRIMAE